MPADLGTPLATAVAEGQAGHAALHTQEREYIEALRTRSDFGAVALDSFTGATDDDKLTAALSAVAGDTYPRTVQLTNRQYSFSQVNRTPFAGMRIMGPRGYGNPERGQTKMACRVALSGNGAWFAATAETFGCSFHSLAFTGGANASVIGGTANWYCLSMRDIFASGLKSIVGSQTTKALLTAASFTGDWEINNSYDTAFYMGGSDNVFWSDGMLLDSGTAYAGDGQSHIWFDSMEKSFIGPLYITAEGSWSAIRVTGPGFNSTSSNQGGPLQFLGLRIEGRNESASSYGALVRVEGGIVILDTCAINYAMSDPANVAIGRTDLGVIQHTGGQLDVVGCTYNRANGVAETVPFVYTSSTGDCLVNRIKRASKANNWSGRPRVAKPTASAENRITDATVTLVSV